ncbi:hypothetical protein EMPS_05647 [Entomortierella parvispora]|uniref:C2H2-type domain-containing protein n=1 Tax=Entomortierella parvispora TaxID=205924 RepID=A0A9P3HAQ5_9FUNG|nr:hypothetical protein EMPS_05647 [Entomortierella parvispora]
MTSAPEELKDLSPASVAMSQPMEVDVPAVAPQDETHLAGDILLADMSTTEEKPEVGTAMLVNDQTPGQQAVELAKELQAQDYPHGYDQKYEHGHHDQSYDQEYAQGQGQDYDNQTYAQGEYAQGHEYVPGTEHGHHQAYEGQEYAEGHYDGSAQAQEGWQHDGTGDNSAYHEKNEPVRRLSFQHHADSSSTEDRPSVKRNASNDGMPAPARRASNARTKVEAEKESSLDPSSASNVAKANRAKRDITKKVPKVYPPRKPRVRSAPAEAEMTLRTDSALSTLASAAVAIKNHQGDISTLSVPPLSPSVHDAQQATASPSQEPPVSPKPPSDQGAEDESAASAASAASTGRPVNPAVLQDNAGYRCELCPGERFGRVHDLKRHQTSKHNEMTWPCDFCHRPFVRRDALLRHYSVKANRKDGVHPTTDDMNRLQEAKARAKLVS